MTTPPPRPMRSTEYVPRIIRPAAQVGRRVTCGECHFQQRVWILHHDNLIRCRGCQTLNYFPVEWH